MRTTNRKAVFDYEIKETIEAGVVLSGGEVKSARLGQVSMDGSFVRIKDGEAWLTNMHIHPYKHADNTDYDPTKPRKLLLAREEIVAIQSKLKSKGLTLVPTAIYSKGPRIKVEIGLARGKKQYEKRDNIKKKDTDRDVERETRGKF